MVRSALLITTAAMVPLITGCLGARREHYEGSRAVAVPEVGPEADRLWETAQTVLREHGFRLDRVDRAAGVITTFPVGSQHFFELWRHDVDTRPDFIEATVNPLRRWVEITLESGEDGLWRTVSVRVHKERLSAPDRQFTSSAAVYQFFGDALPTTTGKTIATGADEAWLDIGQDPAMEEHLLLQILRKCALPKGPGDQATSPADPDPKGGNGAAGGST